MERIALSTVLLFLPFELAGYRVYAQRVGMEETRSCYGHSYDAYRSLGVPVVRERQDGFNGVERPLRDGRLSVLAGEKEEQRSEGAGRFVCWDRFLLVDSRT